jgi:hypothetical protein
MYSLINQLHGAEPFLRIPPVVELLKNFPTFYVTEKFINMFTSALHWSLSRARSVQSILHQPISPRFILILSTLLMNYHKHKLQWIIISKLFYKIYLCNILLIWQDEAFQFHFLQFILSWASFYNCGALADNINTAVVKCLCMYWCFIESSQDWTVAMLQVVWSAGAALLLLAVATLGTPAGKVLHSKVSIYFSWQTSVSCDYIQN